MLHCAVESDVGRYSSPPPPRHWEAVGEGCELIIAGQISFYSISSQPSFSFEQGLSRADSQGKQGLGAGDTWCGTIS